MNIYEKLIAVRRTVPYLKKDNQGYQFSYVSSSQTLGSLREAMDKHGLILVPQVKEKVTSERTTQKGNTEILTELIMTFTWINAEAPEERLQCTWYGQGLDTGEKGVGKAMTYAEKYFLLKFFNIATDKDDPDRFQDKGNGNHETRKRNSKNSSAKKTSASKQNTGNGSIKKIKSLMKDKRLTKTEVKLIDGELKKNPSVERAQQIIDRINELVSGRIPEKGGDHAEKEEQHKEKVFLHAS